MPPEDAASSAALERAFRKRGITSRTGTSVTGVTSTATAAAWSSRCPTTPSCAPTYSSLLVGRVPRTEDLGYEEQGVTLDRGFVTTDDHCRTGVDGIWAVGDIVPGLQLAHRGFQQGIFVAEQIAGLSPRPIDERGIPRVTYSRPEVASVGLTEEQAKEEYGDDASRRSPTTSPATGSRRSCGPRASSSWSAGSTGRLWVSISSASGSAS